MNLAINIKIVTAQDDEVVNLTVNGQEQPTRVVASHRPQPPKPNALRPNGPAAQQAEQTGRDRSEILMELEQHLEEAAKKGGDHLASAVKGLTPEYHRVLAAAIKRRYQPIADAIDAAKLSDKGKPDDEVHF